MEIDDNEEMRSFPPPNIKRDSEEMNKSISSIDPVDPDDAPTAMVVRQKRPRGAQQILQNAEEHETPHGADTRLDLLPKGSLRKRESIMMRHLLMWLDTLPSDRSLLLL